MNPSDPSLKPAPIGTAAAAVLLASTQAADAPAVPDLIARITSTNDAVRGPAWQGAGPSGAPAVPELARVMANPDFEIARAAKRALWQVVHYAGRPGAGAEATAVADALLPLLKTAPNAVRRELLWMLSEIAGESAVPGMAALLGDAELREDARCSLQRIPGTAAVAALKQALGSAPEEFKYALAESLRARGEKVDGYPSRKLVPTRPD
jgi:HEAT repeat protein